MYIVCQSTNELHLGLMYNCSLFEIYSLLCVECKVYSLPKPINQPDKPLLSAVLFTLDIHRPRSGAN